MKAKELLLDFTAFIFLLSIIIFSVSYFIIGGRMEFVTNLMRSLVPFSYFGLVFVFKGNSLKKQYFKFKLENSYDEPIVYLTKTEWKQSFFANIITAFLVFLAAIIDKSVDPTDFLQTIFTFAYLTSIDIFLFRKRDNMVMEMYATRIDKIIHELSIYFLPIVIYSLPFILNPPNIIDFLQSLFAFLMAFLKHRVLFRQKN